MYAMIKVEDTVRISPEMFGEDLNKVIEELVQTTFEGTMRKNHGIILVADNIKPVGDGIVIHGDGDMYQKVEFDALTFKPYLQEVLDGVVCEIVEFGAFCHIGPLDALVHMSQIMNDYVEVNSENEMIVGREKKKTRRRKRGDGGTEKEKRKKREKQTGRFNLPDRVQRDLSSPVSFGRLGRWLL